MLQTGRRIEIESARRTRLGNRPDSALLTPRHPQRRQVGSSERLRSGEEMRQSTSFVAFDGLPEGLDHATRQRRGGGDAYLLTQDRAHHDLERIPTPGYPQPRSRRDTRAYDRVVLELSPDRRRVGAEIEYAPGLFDGVD